MDANEPIYPPATITDEEREAIKAELAALFDWSALTDDE